ncbi:hypothetical protein [Oceanobacillus sojae]|uniref:hypothetical protein n=1 Tax=Oceanobacillus sojae TaxID=582851 RepID=UPI000AB08797
MAAKIFFICILIHFTKNLTELLYYSTFAPENKHLYLIIPGLGMFLIILLAFCHLFIEMQIVYSAAPTNHYAFHGDGFS